LQWRPLLQSLLLLLVRLNELGSVRAVSFTLAVTNGHASV